jgi:hypothetical protein
LLVDRLDIALPLDVPDHLAQDVPSADSAKLPAVYAVVVGTDHPDLTRIRRDAINHLDHRAVHLVPENDDVSALDSAKKIGDFGREYKIPISIRRKQAVTGYFEKLEHHRTG